MDSNDVELQPLQQECEVEFESEFLINFKTTAMESVEHFDIFETEKTVMGETFKRTVERYPMQTRSQAANLLKILAPRDAFVFVHGWIEEPPPGWQRRVDAELFNQVCDEQRLCLSQPYERFGRCDWYRDGCVFLYIEWERLGTPLFRQMVKLINMLHDRFLAKLKQNSEDRKSNQTNQPIQESDNEAQKNESQSADAPCEIKSVSTGQLSEIDSLLAEYKDAYKSKFLTNFKPTKVIGEGTFGCVFEVELNLIGETKIKRAIKRIPMKNSQYDVNNAFKEVIELNRLKPGGIVCCFEAWIETPPPEWQSEVDGIIFEALNYSPSHYHRNAHSFLYIHMELCQSSLEDWLLANNARDLETMIDWFAQIVSTVAYLHKFGPSNILFDSENKLKICDFGIVTNRKKDYSRRIKISEERGDTHDITKDVERTFAQGTPMYMAPEQGGWEYSSKVDIFALGLILVRMCVVMTSDEAAKVFNDYRSGKPSSILDNLPVVKEFVAWLTIVDEEKRPTCEEICVHPLVEHYCNQYRNRILKSLKLF